MKNLDERMKWIFGVENWELYQKMKFVDELLRGSKTLSDDDLADAVEFTAPVELDDQNTEKLVEQPILTIDGLTQLFECRDCGKLKPSTEFYKSNYTKSGLISYCKDCYSIRNKRRVQKAKQELSDANWLNLDKFKREKQLIADWYKNTDERNLYIDTVHAKEIDALLRKTRQCEGLFKMFATDGSIAFTRIDK